MPTEFIFGYLIAQQVNDPWALAVLNAVLAVVLAVGWFRARPRPLSKEVLDAIDRDIRGQRLTVSTFDIYLRERYPTERP